jgi:hypothetical protein
MPLPAAINDVKGQTAAYCPILLAEFTFLDGSEFNIASLPLNAAEGGVQYGGKDYFGRIKSWQIGLVEGMSEQGIDVVPNATVEIADADKFCWLNYERASGKGFKGAQLRAIFIFYDLDNGTFSSNSVRKFTGTCDGATADGDVLRVSATSLTNFTKRYLPPIAIQRRCPLINPVTTEQRATANDEDSPFYECGETRDLGTAPPCKYTNETCTQPLHRANITWDPPIGGRSKEYISGQEIDIRNNPNESKYNDFYPMVYGTGWTTPPILNVVGDGNSTRGEVAVCLGEVTDILRCVVNDVELPPATDINGSAYKVQDPLFRYNIINKGDRDGSPNTDTPYNGTGDPYGNIAALLFVVPRKVADAAATPRVRVLVKGPKIRVYTGPSTFTKIYSDNPVWVLLDILIWSGFQYGDIDMASFVDAANYADETINFTDHNGTTGTRKRFTCTLVIRERRSAADIILGLRRSMNAIFQPNSSDGKLQLLIKRTLAEQQPAQINGSNNGSSIPSKDSGGIGASGYIAYDFNEGCIIQGSLSISKRAISDSPNRVRFQFQDSAYDYALSSMDVVEPEDVWRAGQEVSSAIQVDGPNSYSQSHAVAQVLLAETHRGNNAEDVRGTEWYEFDTTFQGIHLRIGQIIRISHAQHGISSQMLRIQKLQPSKNFETIKIVAHHHDDDWYTDNYKPAPDPRYSQHKRDREARPAYPWGPYAEQPPDGDSMRSTTEWGFRIQPQIETLADGTTRYKVNVIGVVPVNEFSPIKPPLIQQQGFTASSGGSIVGGGWVYFFAVCALDTDGKLSPHSTLCRIPITVAGTSHTATIPVVSWDSAAVGYVVFGGKSPNTLTYQATASGTPTSITVTAFNEAAWGVPDGEFDRLLVKAKRIINGGPFGAAVSDVGTGSMTIAGAGWPVNQWAGHKCSILDLDTWDQLPIANFLVSANTADTLTVTPDPEALGITANCVLVMRSKPTYVGRTISDPNWENTLSNDGLGLTDDLTGCLVRIISGPGRGQVRRIESNTTTSVTVLGDWDQAPVNNESIYIIEEANWLADQADSTPQSNADPTAVFNVLLPVDNYRGQTILVMAFTVDGGLNESVDAITPFREIYIRGIANPTSASSLEGYTTMPIVSGEVEPDLANGLNHQVVLDQDVTVLPAIHSTDVINAGQRMTLKFIQDSAGIRRVSWDAEYIGVANVGLDLTGNTYSTFTFLRNLDDKWELRTSELGRSIT